MIQICTKLHHRHKIICRKTYKRYKDPQLVRDHTKGAKLCYNVTPFVRFCTGCDRDSYNFWISALYLWRRFGTDFDLDFRKSWISVANSPAISSPQSLAEKLVSFSTSVLQSQNLYLEARCCLLQSSTASARTDTTGSMWCCLFQSLHFFS